MSADIFKLKRGSTAAVNAYLPQLGEPVVDTTTNTLKIGDGATLGGLPLTLVASAIKLATSRTIALSGTVTGTIGFDGTSNVTIATSVGSSLQTSLDAKAPLASPTLTGTPLTPTAAQDTNTTQVASTAFVVGQAAAVVPVVDGTATVGTSLRYARQDHVHPTDTSRAPLASPALTGTPTSTTPAVGTNTTQIATSAMVQAEIANKRAWTAYTPSITAASGTYTSVTTTGKYVVIMGICHVQIQITVTTKGTGVTPIVGLPVPALSGSAGYLMLAREGAINGKTGSCTIAAGLTTVNVNAYDNTDLVTADGSIIRISGSYPVA